MGSLPPQQLSIPSSTRQQQPIPLSLQQHITHTPQSVEQPVQHQHKVSVCMSISLPHPSLIPSLPRLVSVR